MLSVALASGFTPTSAIAPQLKTPPASIQVIRATPTLLSFVQKSNPTLKPKEAERIARLVEEVADEFDIEVPLFAAIVRQESHFKTDIKTCRKVEGRRTCDYGMAQVNSYWVDELELDAKRLRSDDGYNLRVAARILKDVLDRHPGQLGYGFYNSADSEMQAEYTGRVERYRKQVVLALAKN